MRTDQWSTDVRRCHAADTGTHCSRSDSNVAKFGRKDFGCINEDNWVAKTDERFAEHGEYNGGFVAVCTQVIYT